MTNTFAIPARITFIFRRRCRFRAMLMLAAAAAADDTTPDAMMLMMPCCCRRLRRCRHDYFRDIAAAIEMPPPCYLSRCFSL